jgi:eukaryotic-like serine/threonine-protein kinase
MHDDPQRRVLELAAELLDLPAEARTERLSQLPTEVAASIAGLIAAADEAELEGFLASRLADGGRPEGSAAQLESGTPVGRFFVLDRVGAGGMGVVYAAYDPQLERKVALKLLRPDRSSATRSRLLREAQALARLAHPNVVSVYDVGTFGEQVFVAMEFVDGRSLGEWLTERRRETREILDVFRAAGAGLSAAHAAGLVHRDFKPDNVLVGHDGRVRVADFGLARAIDTGDADAPAVANASPADSTNPTSPLGRGSTSGSAGGLLATRLTHEGTVLGTPGFVAPEVLTGTPADARSDQYAFCVALRAALAPATGEDEPRRRRRVPASVDAAVTKGLATDPSERFADLDALLGALDIDRRRHRWLGAAALLGVAGVVAAVVSSRFATRPERLCRGEERRLNAVWDERVRTAARDAFARTGTPYAPAAWSGVELQMNRRADAWRTMHRETCEATHVRGEQSAEMLDLRMGCLDRRLEEFGALAVVFATADAKVVERGVDAATSLPDLARCADRAELRAVGRPADPEARAKSNALAAVAARAHAEIGAGRYAAALEILDPALREATVLAHPPTEALLRLRRGTALFLSDDLATAVTELERASTTAERGSDDRTALQALASRSLILGAYLGKLDDAARVLDLAGAKLERLGGDPALQADVETSRAFLHVNRGETALAVAAAERALALRTETAGAESTLAARALANLGDLVAWSGDATRALELRSRAAALLERLLGDRHPTFAGSLHSLAVGQRDAGHALEALRLFDREIELRRATLGSSHRSVATALMDRAMTHDALGQSAQAEADARAALALFGAAGVAGDTDVVYANSSLAETLRKSGRAAEALRHADRAIADGEKIWGEGHFFLVQFLVHRAMCLEDLRRFEEAAAALRRARASIGPGSEIAPFEVAKLDFIEARVELARGDRSRALRLAREAGSTLEGAPDTPRTRELCDALGAWLKTAAAHTTAHRRASETLELAAARSADGRWVRR